MKFTAATQPSKLQSDERLVRRAKKGDRRAFEAIFERYHQDLYRFCLTLVGSRQDAEDALQATMVKMMRALPGEAREIQLRPWIYRIARNESIDTVRRRRETIAIVPEQIVAGPGLVETAESRERLGRLIDDLAELPERQRAALVMRELGDLEFAEIASALETSAEAARQAVYEARLSLRQMESGREMNCDEVLWAISEADGRVVRKREIQAHMRGCPDCRAFQESISRRRGELRAIAPLPLAGSAAILQGALGAGSGAGGSVAGAAGAGAGKALLGSTVAKTAATCAVVAAIGTTAADRSGLVNVPIGVGSGQTEQTSTPSEEPSRARSPSSANEQSPAAAAAVSAGHTSSHRGSTAGNRQSGSGRSSTPSPGGGNQASSPAALPGNSGQATHGAVEPTKNAAKRGQGKQAGLPPSSAHGQQTAAAHKSPHGNVSPGTPRGMAKGPAPHPQQPPQRKLQPEREAAPPPERPAPEPPAHAAPEKGEKSANRATGMQPELAESPE